jgi:hypothetical protein
MAGMMMKGRAGKKRPQESGRKRAGRDHVEGGDCIAIAKAFAIKKG